MESVIERKSILEHVALACARAARVSSDETQLAAWRNAVHTGMKRSQAISLKIQTHETETFISDV
jgi:hypothetical protein